MNYKRFLGAASAALMVVIVVTLVLAPGAWAQNKFKTLHKFKHYGDGNLPSSTLVFDAAGNLYGTTVKGGHGGYGTVFKLMRNSDGSWKETVLYSFNPQVKVKDGYRPYGGVIFDQAGNLYGTTGNGGAYNHGTVFKLTPNSDGSWTESVLYSFNSGDGFGPEAGLIFDQAGNLYGTTGYGGTYEHGTVFKLTPNSDGSWTESVLYSFCSLTNCSDGRYSEARVIFDQDGNLYGTTADGGVNDHGTVFKLTPNANGSWTESVLHSFNYTDGAAPVSGLIFDRVGNLYGTATLGGDYPSCGDAFRLTPNSDGTWTESVLHSFNGGDGFGPVAGLIFDQAGNFYGTTELGGANYGVVFKLWSNSNGGWSYRVLHTFINHPGASPQADLIFDAAGNLYGTTSGDDDTTFGSVFEITP